MEAAKANIAKGKVVVAMSGGVDSSVTAAVLQMQGYDVIGMSVQTFDAAKEVKDRFDSCCSISDMDDARRVCEKLGIPHFVVNAVEAFEAQVIDSFVSEYLNGRTPNPCVLCNTFIKFDFLMERAREVGAEKVATGHYAKVRFDEATQRYSVVRAVDEHKDQSYYLFGLTQEQLSRTLFPLGELRKIQVRKLAEEFGLLRVSKKPDSHEICFVGSEGYAKFIENRISATVLGKTDFILPDDTKVPAKVGLHNFTIGQKKGIPENVQSFALKAGFSPGDLFVVKIDPEANLAYLGDESRLKKKYFVADRFNWMTGKDFFLDRPVRVRIRSLQEPAKAMVRLYAEGQVLITFDAAQRAITPGQAAVIYNENEEVLGGGWIRTVLEEKDVASLG
jgi:tRNA-specific 2-thiouridylase